MNLHEYQAKHWFKQYGLAVPESKVIRDAQEAPLVFDELPTDKVVIKAQVHAGGRGKAGGVKIANNKQEALDIAKNMLGKRLVTFQTDEHGQPVNVLLMEAVSDIDKELYLGAVMDRATRSITFMASTEGGVDIEKVAQETPEKILKAQASAIVGLMPFQARELGFGLGLNMAQIKQFTKIIMGLYKLFIERDLTLIEINPLVITQSGDLVCLDGKINIDENALYRQAKLAEMRDPTQEDASENRAKDWELSYVALEGNIGCMVNGAGLAMATMDLIKLHGGDPANFLDVGGTATKERVTEAFKIILSDQNVKAVLVNIFGGIVRCDLIAEGIIGAVEEVGIQVPVVVRLEGNNATLGREKLDSCSFNIMAAESLTDAAKKVVATVGGAA